MLLALCCCCVCLFKCLEFLLCFLLSEVLVCICPDRLVTVWAKQQQQQQGCMCSSAGGVSQGIDLTVSSFRKSDQINV
jgi:hypothetical protein